MPKKIIFKSWKPFHYHYKLSGNLLSNPRGGSLAPDGAKFPPPHLKKLQKLEWFCVFAVKRKHAKMTLKKSFINFEWVNLRLIKQRTQRMKKNVEKIAQFWPTKTPKNELLTLN